MPWALCIMLTIYGILAIVFAFVEPPGFLRSWFRVPAIFAFLPNRWIVPAGRIFVGLGMFALVAFIVVKVLQAQ